MTPEEYINHHRIEASKKVLPEESLKDVPISLIASQIGYKKRILSLPRVKKLEKWSGF